MLRLARHFPAVVVTGARQTGKTTLLTSLFPDHNYVSLDLPAEARLAEEDPQSFLSRHPAPLLVDEVQYAPRLFRHLKAEIDRNREANARRKQAEGTPRAPGRQTGARDPALAAKRAIARNGLLPRQPKSPGRTNSAGNKRISIA